MVRYITKDEIGKQVHDMIMSSSKSRSSTSLPFLAFDNREAEYDCEVCDSDKIKFQYNISEAAGTDSVIFDWNVDLERIYLTGYVCPNCGYAEIQLHENSPDNPGEVILTDEGL